jgi:hypothetical protein
MSGGTRQYLAALEQTCPETGQGLILVCFGLFQLVSVKSKHRNSLFRNRSETTEINVLFRIVPKLVSVPVSVVSNPN